MVLIERAEAMRELAKEHEASILDEIRLNINKSIKAAAKAGKYSYTYNVTDTVKELPSCIVEELLNAGYGIDETNHIISWDNVDIILNK